ncbi:hypothetical protein CNEO4_240040 [Clostridium neonatale]|nr:hypothetical protein CNEO4_240040 [Clostridium neonatale]
MLLRFCWLGNIIYISFNYSSHLFIEIQYVTRCYIQVTNNRSYNYFYFTHKILTNKSKCFKIINVEKKFVII